MSRPLLQVVDRETGELFGCPQCQHREDVIKGLEKDLRVAKGTITKLQRDIEIDARKHALWPEAEAIFDWWRLATWHPGTRFQADEFHQALPRLKERGPVGLLKAICGAAYDPGSKEMRNGKLEVFDDWELICRSRAKCDSFAKRVPGGEADERTWRVWLVQRIEANLS